MAMDKTALESAIYTLLITTPLDSNGVTSATTKQFQQADGSVKIEVTPVRGPVYMDKNTARVLGKGIARAVIDHITSSAETSSGDTIK